MSSEAVTGFFGAQCVCRDCKLTWPSHPPGPRTLYTVSVAPEGLELRGGESTQGKRCAAGSMTQKDESPEEATNPYWSDELLAVLAEALGDEDRARQTLEGIIQQAQEGKAMRTLSTERLASHGNVWR